MPTLIEQLLHWQMLAAFMTAGGFILLGLILIWLVIRVSRLESKLREFYKAFGQSED